MLLVFSQEPSTSSIRIEWTALEGRTLGRMSGPRVEVGIPLQLGVISNSAELNNVSDGLERSSDTVL